MAAVATFPSQKHIRRMAPGLKLVAARRLYANPREGFNSNEQKLYDEVGRSSQSRLTSYLHHHVSRLPRNKVQPPRRPRGLGDEDCRALAADYAVALPSAVPPSRPRRKPTLERQEAFRAPSWVHDVVEKDSDLYRLGLLYDDDEHERGSGFDLDAIVHPDPTWYSVRPAKRARRSHSRHKGREAIFFDDENPCLPLDLSFSSLGSDLEIARLLAPNVDEIIVTNDEVVISPTARSDHCLAAAPSLAVIHEILDEEHEGSTHPLQNTPLEQAINGFPDLVSDSDEEQEEDGREGAGGGHDDWALLSADDVASDVDTGNAEDDDGVESASVTACDAWLIVQSDSL